MSEEKAVKRDRGIKVKVVRGIWTEENGKPIKVTVGTEIVLSKAQVKHYGDAVTRDIDDED